jgi:putative heme degradation protein
MSDRIPHKRERLDVAPAALLSRLPSIGKVMINAEHRGATHERIGKVEQVRVVDGWIVCEGAEHNSRIRIAAIDEIIVDRTSVMRDKAYPRIELRDRDGKAVSNITGFEGLEPFDAILAEFPQGTELPLEERGAAGEHGELAESDPGLVPFAAVERNGGRVTVELDLPSFRQVWEAEMPAIKAAMGYINIILPDFHLHLRGGAVASWRREENAGRVRFVALDTEGTELRLAMSGVPASFG